VQKKSQSFVKIGPRALFNLFRGVRDCLPILAGVNNVPTVYHRSKTHDTSKCIHTKQTPYKVA